ncbi:MAG: DUF814 domain-containing protein [Bacteroidetes bacterium]|nr:DUF814 domain-containing protein [Bacteroidota bacterium]
MFTSWLTYNRVAEELDGRLRGVRIEAVYTQQKHELVLEFVRGDEAVHLVFSTLPRLASLQLKDDFARARKNALDLLPDAVGDTVSSVAVAADDRIVRFVLASGRALYALLFPNRANLLLMEGETLLDSYKQMNAPAAVAAHDFDSPPSPPNDDDVRAALETPDLTVTDALKQLRPWLSGRFAAELLHRSVIDGARQAAGINDADPTHLCVHLTHLLEEADAGESRVYLDGQMPVCFSLVEMRHLGAMEQQRFPTALEGVAFYLRRHFSGGGYTITRERVRKTVLRERDRVERILSKLVPPEQLKRQADQYEKFGNLLMIHLYAQPTQPGRMVVPDIFIDPRLVVEIPLKPRLTVLENAQQYFDKARNSRASVDHVVERKVRMDRRLAALDETLAALDAAEDMNALRQLLKEHNSLMDELGLTPKGEKNEAPFPFRRFVVAGGFEVWAGKNSANNDLLTVRHSRPNDLWFHARGVGGSHVVIKVGSAPGEPSKEAIRQAAAIAAYYSKHRNAKHVPVAYTEKKYVRKPKGAAPGSVMVDREKVIMADPGLPEGAKDED